MSRQRRHAGLRRRRWLHQPGEPCVLTTHLSSLLVQSPPGVLQVTQAMLDHKAPAEMSLGIVPMGTANDFATGLGIPEDPWEAMQLAAHDTAMPIDVGLVNDQASTCCAAVDQDCNEA